MKHHCHALGCGKSCPPKHLMCRECWALVPREMQDEVYRTVGLRDKGAVDASWAPWWRAQAHAIHHVAMLRQPNTDKGQKYLARELAFADRLDMPEGNNCEHGDHAAPEGQRFCSTACQRCEHESNEETGCDNICGREPAVD